MGMPCAGRQGDVQRLDDEAQRLDHALPLEVGSGPTADEYGLPSRSSIA